MHLDVWLQCPRCKYTPCFGREMEDTEPVYFHPRKLPSWYKVKVEQAFHKHIPDMLCTICGGEMQLHKVWVNVWKKVKEELVKPKQPPLKSVASKEVMMNYQFLAPTVDGKLSRYFLPSGLLGQYKCVNWKCKYVRYVTL